MDKKHGAAVAGLLAFFQALELLAGTVVAGYRADFQVGTMPSGWSYLWNENGSITNPADFVFLETDVLSTNEWQTDGANPGRPDPGQGGHLRLTDVGVCSGQTEPDAYAIAGFATQASGRHFLTDSWVVLNSTNSSGVELRVFVDNEVPLLVETIATAGQTNHFEMDLGLLAPGDTVYVALGPGADPVNDFCQWDFSIGREPTWFGSGYPDPEEVPVPANRLALGQLDIFQGGRPRCFSFRDDYLSARSYTVFSNTISQSHGHAPKMFSEERVVSIDNQPLMAQYALECPEKMLLCHYNLKEIKLMRHTEFADFSPGHWLYYPGSVLTHAVSETDTVLTVQDAANFQDLDPVGSPTNNSVVALVPVDSTGGKVWEDA
ncbi:MAG: hypothetical protein U9P12_05195, partial [Verrucomicrobiota bacterium]|nr:hypothetical protein [Verrucomicrobiota bacterium]